MKCPQCSTNHSYREGMRCSSCGYSFALNPKEKPNVTDMAFKIALDRLSGPDQHYFTSNQLYAEIYRMVAKKIRKNRIKNAVAFGFVGFIGLSVLSSIVFSTILETAGSGGVLPVALVLSIVGSIWYVRRPVTVSPQTVSRLISKYRSVHSIDRLVDGKQFLHSKPNTVDHEILDYAPEQILIVERNDMVDMLLMNRFHFDNKTLVLSADKYPENAFKAFLRFREQHPQTPVSLIHDASEKGLRLKEKILSDKSWNLTEENVRDLGLFPEDVDRIKTPVIFPGVWSESRKYPKTSAVDSTADKIRKGFTMPADVVPARAVMGALALAVVSGFPLLSKELLAQQGLTDGETYTSGGYG